MKRFSTFMAENTFLQLKHYDLAKRGFARVPVFVDKVKDKEYFSTDKGAVMITSPDWKTLDAEMRVNGYSAMMKGKTDKGKNVTVKYPHEFHKTPEFGGKGKGSGTAAEDRELAALRKEIERAMVKDGISVLPMIVGKRKVMVVGVESTGGTFWNSTSPTSTVFSVGTAGDSNGSGYTLVAYCFSEVKGFSKFGEYIGGNANANGPFVYLGFKPAFVMVRDSDYAENWLMYDNERPGYNLNNNHLFANTNDQETASTANTMDFLSNGFKIRSTNNGLNRSGGDFLYMAFAEHPFVSSSGTPVTAR